MERQHVYEVKKNRFNYYLPTSLPFMIIWSPAFLGDYSNPFASVVELLACILVFIGLQACFVGFLLTRLSAAERVIALTWSVFLMTYLYTKNFWLITGGAGLFALSFLIQIVKKTGLLKIQRSKNHHV